MNAGQLIHRCDLEKDVITYVAGAKTATPTVYANGVPCQFTYLRGDERWAAHQIQSGNNIHVLMRYRTDVLAAHRIVYRGKKYEIKAVTPDEANRAELVVECRG